MKTAEVIKKEIEEILFNGVVYAEELDVTTENIMKTVLQFLKKGMKEAYVSGFLENFGRFYISNKPDKEIAEDFFQKWYKNQIKEA